MKILHINTSDQLGGAEQFAYDFVHSSPHECKLLVSNKTSSSDKVFEFDKTLLDKILFFFDRVIYKIGIKKRLRQIFSMQDEYNFTYRKLKKLSIYQDADIVHLHNIHGGYFDLDALVDISRDKPIVWTLHDMWAITGGEAHTFGNENYKLGDGKFPNKNIYPLNSPLIDRRQHFLERKKNIYKIIAKNTSWIPGSYWLEDCVKQSFVYNKHMNVKAIRYGIDVSLFSNFNARNWLEPRILFFNSKSPFKGCDIFFNLINEIKFPFELHVMGDAIASVNPNVRIIHHDFFSDRKDLSGLYNSCDILVFPSKADTFPCTVLEAMACGVCIVGSNVGGITEQLQNDNGILFNREDKNSLLDKINYCLTNLEEIRGIGQKASLTAKEKYNIRKMHEEYSSVYSFSH